MDELGERVLKHFRIKKTEAINKLVHALRVPKKSLNQVLYRLERQSLVVRVQDSPPVWGLPEYASSPNPPSPAGRMTRKRKAKEMEQIKNTDHESNEMSTKILNYLESKKAAKPMEIAKAVGVTKPSVNPFLYALERKGLIMKNSGKSLTWSLSNRHDHTAENFSSDTQASTSGQQFVPNSGDFPVFQDTKLFRTDIGLDMEDTELLSGETEDNNLDLNKGLGTGYEYNGPLMKKETEFESETGEYSRENTFNSIKYEVTEDVEMENSCNSETECNVIASINNGEIQSEDIVKSESCEDMVQIIDSKQSEADSEIQNMDFDNNSQSMLNEVETVSDVRLVRNVSSFHSPNVSISKSDDNGMCTSEIPLLNTRDLSELKNDNQQESDQLSVENHRRLSPTSTPDILNEALDLGDEIAILNEENSTQSMENDSDSKSNLKAINCNMEHCDKILQVLSTLPGCAEFVLVNRTSLDKVDFETALGKCQELGFVSGCTKLWRITPEGIDYIEDKFGTNERETSSSNIGPSVQTKKFSGPPPSPMALLKSRAGFASGSSMALSSQQAVSNKRDRSPLNRSSFQPSLTNNQVRIPTMRHNVAINSISSSQGSMRNPLNQSLFPTDNSVHTKKKLTDMSEISDVNSCLWNKDPDEIRSPPRSLYQTKPTDLSSSFNQSSFKQPEVPVQDQTMSRKNIPSKYANYPNKVSSTQVLRNINSKSSWPSQDNKTVSTKPSIPPSPMEILSKNLKKTEISPPNTPPSKTYNPLLANSQQSAHNSLSIQRQSDGNQISQSLNSSKSSLMAGHFGKQSLLSSNTIRMSGQFGNQSIKSSTPSLMSGQFGNQTMSLQVNHNQSGTAQPINTDFKSLPASVNTIGCVVNTGLNSLALSNESFNALNKNAVSALMEYAQSRKMQARVEVIGQRGPPHRPTFTMAAYVGNRQFSPVTCTNKKDGRKEACDIAMRQLVAEGQFQAETASEAAGSKPQASLETMTHFDKIAALTHRGFTALVSQITAESFAGRKVIAGLVMKRSDDDTGVLISLGTGNRCITGQQLSLQGNTVNDSHAEIITRRGFMRFLYKQLLDYDPTKTNPLFERSRTGKLQIRPKITFHLYISTAPCGDGALFSPRDAESNKTPVDSRIRPPHEPVFSSNVQGLLRTKVEGGEGTIPIEPGFKGQTFDGIQRGERLRTMSCTDKVCRWNVVGMQGALLSHFIEPVYLDSLTLGLLYDHGHLSRAVCCRVGRGPTDIDNLLPTNYRLNHPWLGRVTTCDPPREVQKTKAVSVNWSFGDSAAEVTDGTLGLCNTSIEKGMFSRCSKRNMYNSFKSVCEKFGRQDLLTAENYKDAKMMASDFQEAREAMLCKFKENKYGPWVSKPVEEEMFTWEET